MSTDTLPAVTVSLPPPEGPGFVHASLALVDGAYVATALIAAGACLLREVPMGVSSPAAGGASNGAGAAPVSPPAPDLWHFGSPAARVTASCPALSRTRHSCAPNATLAAPLRWHPRAGRTVLSLLALRDIAPGEAVTASRVELLQSPDARRDAARRVLGRACDCPRCCVGGEAGGGVGSGSRSSSVGGDGSDAPTSPPPWWLGADAALTAARAGVLPPADADGSAARGAALSAMRCAFEELLVLSDSGAPGALAAARAFLDGPAAACGLAPSHWRVIEARTRAVALACAAREWRAAWRSLEELARGVFAVLPPAHADAQRATMALADVCVRGWQRDEPRVALAETAGALVGGRSGPVGGTALAAMVRASAPARLYLEFAHVNA